MIKKQQKWIALLVTLTFMGLLQVSTMPCEASAAGTTEQISAAGAEQGPGTIEEEGDSGFVGKKKSILPIVLIGVGVVAAAAVLFLVVLKSGYDLTGNWLYSWKYDGDAAWVDSNQLAVFSGDKKSGTLTIWGYPGTYTVDSKNVAFTIDYLEYGPNDYVSHAGTFTTKDKITGTWIYHDGGWGGPFEMVRSGSTAGSGAAPARNADQRKTNRK
jgi:hypothetical protein